jgi:hypothetical protein
VPAPHVPRDKKIHQPSKDIILVDLEIFWRIPGPRKLLFRAVALFCITYRGKLLQHKLIAVQCTKKSTQVPISPVPQYGYWLQKIIFEYSFYYTQEKWFLKHTTRASPARVTEKQIHQPSPLFRVVLLRFSAQLTGENYYSTSWYVYSVTKKIPEYRYPLYPSTGFGFEKLFFSIVFTKLKKSDFWNIQPVPVPNVTRTKKIHHAAFQGYYPES